MAKALRLPSFPRLTRILRLSDPTPDAFKAEKTVKVLLVIALAGQTSIRPPRQVT